MNTQPANVPSTRITVPVPSTIAYMAIGAHAVLRSRGENIALNEFNGQCGFVEVLCEQALFVDRVAQPFSDAGEHPGVFVYEVAEPFGKEYAKALLAEGIGADAKKVLRNVMHEAGYDKAALAAAIEAAASTDATRRREAVPAFRNRE
ncbi:hypothetical protein [Paraburkholderia sp. SIMBA_054]|uniref:hypothetical protein n=1 Tax=Paraburkholderia sp. SIMBA_054 TaxID=3085795 RepID=UPI00397B849B